MDEIVQKLKKVGQAVESAKCRQAELNGRRKQLLEQLANEFHLSSVSDAEAQIEKMTEEIEEIEKDLDVVVSDLSDVVEKYEGLEK